MMNALNNYQNGDSHLQNDDSSQKSEADHESCSVASEEIDEVSVVQSWSVDKVITWLQENLSFEQHRMKERVQIFLKEDVDGKVLTDLKRSHRACFGMSDVEWLMFTEARKKLLELSERIGSARQQFGVSPSRNNVECILPMEGIFPGSSRLSRFSRSYTAMFSKSYGPSLLKMFNIPKIQWGTDSPKGDQNKSEEEVESLRRELASADERESNLHARLEHLDELLRSAKLASYLYTRTRWLALPGEPPIEDDTDVNDWMQKLVVFHGSCIFFYLSSTDISPQDSVLLEEITEAGLMPTVVEEYDNQQWYTFQVTSCHGVRFECSSIHKFQLLELRKLLQAHQTCNKMCSGCTCIFVSRAKKLWQSIF